MERKINRLPKGVARQEVVRNFGMQDPRLEVGPWAFVIFGDNTDGTGTEVPDVDGFNSVEAGATEFYEYTQPTVQD